MKKKVLIRISMNDEKSRCKAMKTAVSLSGVEAVALKGVDKTQIEVIGDEIDAADLTTLMRKKVGHADLLSVSDAVGKSSGDKEPKNPKPETKPQPPSPSPPVVLFYPPYDACYNHALWIRDPDPYCYNSSSSCSIL